MERVAEPQHSRAGEKLDFRSRFVSPPPNATDVMVRFVNSQDAATTTK